MNNSTKQKIILVSVALVSALSLGILLYIKNDLIHDFLNYLIYFLITGIVTPIGILLWKAVSRPQEFGIKSKDQQNTAESRLDELLDEIDSFRKKWNKGIPLLTSGYRYQIIRKTIWSQNPKKIREHSQKLQQKIKSVRQLKPYLEMNMFTSLGNVVDRIAVLGAEVESVFMTVRSEKEALSSDPQKIEKLVADGDKISDELKSFIPQLEKLRKHLP